MNQNSRSHALKQHLRRRLAEDEALFDWFEASNSDGLWYRDLTQANHIWFSDGYFRLFGYATSPDKQGLTYWRDPMFQEDVETSEEGLAGPIEEPGAASDNILRFLHQDGTVLWLRCRARAVRNAQDQVTHLLCTVADLTPLVNAEHQLESLTNDLYEVNQRHELALKASSIGIWDYDCLNDVLVWSPEMYNLYQVKPEDFTHNYQAWLNLVLPADRKATEAKFEKLVSECGKKFATEFRVICPGMKLRTIAVNATIFYRENLPFRVLGANWDVTETRDREWVLQQRTHELKRSNRDLEEFATIVSNDLQEPLRKIHGFAELLAEECSEDISEDGRFYLGRITTAGSRMEQLISHLLELSQVSRSDLEPAPVPLNELVEELKSESETTLDLASESLPTISADRHLLRQVLFNLVHNSHKFRKKNTVATIRITNSGLVDHQDRTYWEMRLSDQGIGFDAADNERIFKPFERLHKGDRDGGAGIGLTLCRKIMERHGGWIFSEGSRDCGAVFRLLFPETVLLKPA